VTIQKYSSARWTALSTLQPAEDPEPVLVRDLEEEVAEVLHAFHP